MKRSLKKVAGFEGGYRPISREYIYNIVLANTVII